MTGAKLRRGLPSLAAGLCLLTLFVVHYPQNTGIRGLFLFAGVFLFGNGISILRSGVTVSFEGGAKRKDPDATETPAADGRTAGE